MGGGQPAVVGTFESRLLLSALNDTASLSGTQRSVEVDVLANDSGTNKSIVGIGNRTSHVNGGMVAYSDAPNGKLTYSLVTTGIKTLGDFENIKNRALGQIATWLADEIRQINEHYDAVNTTIDRFSAFAGQFGTWWAWVAGGTATVGSYAGPVGKVGGKALGFVIGAFAASGIVDNITATAESHRLCDLSRTATIRYAEARAQILTDSLYTQITYVPSPKAYGNDSFTYTMSEMILRPMPGMPGMMVPTMVLSSATVSINCNIMDYSAMVMNVDNWINSTQGPLNSHMYAGTYNLDREYGDMLLRYAAIQGWNIAYQPQFAMTWYSGTANYFGLDAASIAIELTRIGHTP